MSSSDEKWAKFLRRCFECRVEPGEFAQLSKVLNSRSPITEGNLIDLLLQSPAGTTTKYDPLLPLYIDCLCRLGRLNASTALACLLKHSSIRAKSRSPSAAQGQLHSVSCTLMTDIKVIQDLTLSISTGVIPKTGLEASSIFEVIVDWINALMSWHNDNLDEEQQTGGLTSSPDAISLFESLGVLLAALCNSAKGLEILSAIGNDALKVRLGQALSIYVPLSVGVLRNRLDALQKEFNLFGEQPSKALEMSMMDAVNVNALDFEASVMDGPVINSRAGLYLYINAMLVGRPLVDDTMFHNYLTNRYGSQYEVLIEDLITAAFDVLSNAMYRNESSRTMFLFRSFLVNKLPPFLAVMAATSMVPIPMEMCISHALNRVDPNAFPSLSQMFSMQGNTALSEVRQEFLFACALHKLIPEASIERLLGENPMQTLPTGGQYVKDGLIAQINSNPERAEQLINELEAMDGNAGAIVGAITEVISTLCTQKETMTLKNVCNSLSRRPQALDVILLFRSSRQVLQPLCALLDSWRWDEDQGENQPVYDEFGSILLLVLAFKHRYDLSSFDLGINGNDSFVLKLLDRGSCSHKVDGLNDKQSKDLGAWIGALFIAEGISEETMSACSPQEFYLLVATLFDQSLGACEVGKLEFETLKGGFEYLLEPFLLPSLVVALTWLGNHIWESESDPSISLKALQFLINPGSVSGEAGAIHQTVLHITARNLEEQMKDVRTRQPSRSDIKPILDSLEPYLSFQRIGSCHRSEFENWTSHSGGGLLGSLRSTVQALVLWSTNPEISVSPHTYTHRQLLAGIRMLGAVRVLDSLVEETKSQTEAGSGDLALDIVATMICSPTAESFAVGQNMYRAFDPQREASPRCPILTLRHALTLQYNNLSKIAERDPLRAEVIVRLSRRVNALITPPSQLSNLDVTDIIQNMHLQGVGEHDQMDIEGTGAGITGPGVGDEDAENINQMLNEAAAVAAAGLDNGVGQGISLGTTGSALNTSLDEMLNAADMAVENPEFLDLDMEGMF